MLGMFVGCGGRPGEREYEKAINAWEKGNLVQARTLFEKAAGRLTANESKAMAYNNLGLVLWELDEPGEAAEAFDSACGLTDSVTEANLNLAIALFHDGQLDKSRLPLNMYLGEHPESKTALALQSLIAAQNQDWAQAARVMGEAAAADPDDPAAQNDLALAELNHDQNSAQAIARLKQITARHPDYVPALYNLGVIHDQWLQDKPTALGYYRDYLSKAGADASHAQAARNAVERLNAGDTGTSVTDPAAATRFIKEGARLYGEKQYAQAVVQFRKAIEADPSQQKAYYNLGLANFYLADYQQARQAFMQALNIDPDNADARYMLSYSYVQLKRWDDAEREARALNRIDPARGDDLLKHIEATRQ